MKKQLGTIISSLCFVAGVTLVIAGIACFSKALAVILIGVVFCAIGINVSKEGTTQ